MPKAIVVLNAGSSSIKFSLFIERGSTLEADVRGLFEGIGTAERFTMKAPDGSVKIDRSWPESVKLGHEEAFDHLVGHLREELADNQLIGIGHRVVHGGLLYTRPVRVDAGILEALESLTPLAPLHQPHNLLPIRRALERLPDVPQIACFDTSFHRSQPEVAQMYALPENLRQAGILRYGFHGLSYEYIASMLPEIDARAAGGRTVVLHLGNGSSMCALAGGQSLAATMGFTAVDGLPMGTRSGSLDPGIILHLIDRHHMDARRIEKLLYKESGLLGISGISSDMRTLLASREPQARLAVDYFLYRIGRELGSLAAALGGLDALVFTAGIGENAVPIRSRVCRDAAWLGVELDEAANNTGRQRISSPTSRVAVYVLPTNEEVMIARHTQRLLQNN
jgi:acetate kinase